MKKIIKIFFIFFLVSVSIFCFYIYKLRSLAVEGNRIFELRCTDVNPPLIAYKNSFLKWADYINTPEKYEESEAVVFLDDYIFEMRKYVVEENKWLDTSKSYINRWDFKLIEPWYIKQANEYQQKMYEGYRDDAQTMLAVWNNKTESDELFTKQTEARDRLIQAEQKYLDFYDQISNMTDWRMIFGYVSIPEGCNEENMTIPDTSGSIDWSGTPTPEPRVIPGLENISG